MLKPYLALHTSQVSLFEQLNEISTFLESTLDMQPFLGAYKRTNLLAHRQPEKGLARHPMAADRHSPMFEYVDL